MPLLHIRQHIQWLSLGMTCLTLVGPSTILAQTIRPTLPPQKTVSQPSAKSLKPLPSSLGLAQTIEAALQGAEGAVAQVVVALAQVRAPVAMLKAKSTNSVDVEALLEEVERLADLTMNVYQNAIIASSDEAILASSAANPVGGNDDPDSRQSHRCRDAVDRHARGSSQ